MYWFLHFLYTGELEFKDEEDETEYDSLDSHIAQELVLGVTVGDPWDWRTVAIDENGSIKVVQSPTMPRKKSESPGDSSRSHVSAKSAQSAASASSTSSPVRGKMGTSLTCEGKAKDPGIRTRPSSAFSSATSQSAALARTRSSPTTPQATAAVRVRPAADPHAHPAGLIPPASAFSIYALAHRYQLDELSRLAQNHLLAHLKPATSCSLLLASYRFQELHLVVEDYVIEHWEAVQSSVGLLIGNHCSWKLNCLLSCC